MTIAVYKISKRWKRIGMKLLVVVEVHDIGYQEETERADKWACCGLVFFYINLTATTLWYCFGYNMGRLIQLGLGCLSKQVIPKYYLDQYFYFRISTLVLVAFSNHDSI